MKMKSIFLNGLGFLLGMFFLSSAYAQVSTLAPPVQTIEVDTFIDLLPSAHPSCETGHAAGFCSLREAVNQVMRNSLGHENDCFKIHLQHGTYTLSIPKSTYEAGEDQNQNGDLDIQMTGNNTLLMEGVGPLQSVIAMGNFAQNEMSDRVMQVIRGNVYLKDLRIYNGRSWESQANQEGTGGGILINAAGVLTTENVLIDGNRIFHGCGAGVTNYGSFHAIRSSITNNIIEGDIITIPDEYDHLASGGGLCNVTRGTATIEQSTLYNNEAKRYGGGIYNGYDANLRVINSTIATNLVRNGYRETGNTYSPYEVYGEGGGVYNSNNGHVTLINSTIAFNHSVVDSGGIANGSVHNIVTSAIVPNPPGTVNIQNSIILYNTTPRSTYGRGMVLQDINCQGPMNSLGNNISDTSCENLSHTDLNDRHINAATEDLSIPVIEWTPVMDGVQYFYPIGNILSPAFNGVRSSQAPAEACPGIDQRGVRRPQGVACDVGAYEMTSNVDSIIGRFLDVPVSATSQQSLTIINNGPFVTIQDLAIENPNPPDSAGSFWVLNRQCVGHRIGQDLENADCPYTLHFSPRHAGTITADLLIRYDSAGETMEKRIPIMGTAFYAPGLIVIPTPTLNMSTPTIDNTPSEKSPLAKDPSDLLKGTSKDPAGDLSKETLKNSSEPQKGIEDKENTNTDDKSVSPKSGK